MEAVTIINEFLKIEPEIKNNSTERTIIKGAIEFKNVSYTYEDTAIDALKNISFTVNQGETLAILGKNKKKCFDCYMNTIEKKYENNDSASSDAVGCDLILMDCAIKHLH